MLFSTNGTIVRNRLFISGMSLEEFKKKYFTGDNFDLEKVAKFPTEFPLEYTWENSSNLCLYLCALSPKVARSLENVEKMNGNSFNSFLRRIKEGNSFLYDFFPSEESFDRELKGYLTPIQERIKDAKNQLALFEKYGTVSSYEWALNNWGSASLAFPTYEENGRIIFDTSTLAPIKAIEKISKDNPHAILFLDFASSDKGFDCGFAVYKSGYYLKKGIYKDHGEEALRLYNSIYVGYGDIMDNLYCKKVGMTFIGKESKDNGKQASLG